MKLQSSLTQFVGCDHPLETAKTVIFGAGYDGTVTLRPGTRFGPEAMRDLSIGLEMYSPYQDLNIGDFAIADAGDLDLPFGDTDTTLRMIEEETREIVKAGKQPVMLGGEHLLTLATVKAVHEAYPDLHVIHFDAHTDLRDEFMGVELSHATVIKQVWRILGDKKVHSFGIRSGLGEEFVFGREHLDFNPFSLACLKDRIADYGLVEQQIPVYLTIDLDVLDPSVFPGTGTPEPGGVDFHTLLNAILAMRGLNIVGFDLVELAPDYDASGCSTLVACKVLRECLLAFSPRP